MEPLQEHTNLFVNGKFDLMIEGEDRVSIIRYWTHEDYFDITDGWNTGKVEVGNCTLIARKKEDMTDKEWGDIERIYRVRYQDQHKYDGKIMIYLL